MRAKNILVAVALTMVLATAVPGDVSAEPLRISSRAIRHVTSSHEINLVYPATGVMRIDALIERWAGTLEDDFRQDLRNAEDDEVRGTQRWSSVLSHEVKQNDDEVLSLVFAHYTYSGGAHPNTTFRTFHFLLPDGYEAEIAELFSVAGIRRISKSSIEQLTASLAQQDGLGDTNWIRRGAGPNPANFARFVLTKEWLTVMFDAYQVAPYAAGPQEVRIPMGELRGLLRADPRAPAASFDCLAARSRVEKAVCASGALARLDRRLSELYLERLAWAEAAGQVSLLRQEQRAWLTRRDTTCSGPGSSSTDCLSRLYQDRLGDLGPEGGP